MAEGSSSNSGSGSEWGLISKVVSFEVVRGSAADLSPQSLRAVEESSLDMISQ